MKKEHARSRRQKGGTSLELEVKGMLTPQEYRVLLAFFGKSNGWSVEQVNSYFDTAECALDKQKAMFRVRIRRGQCELTIKEPGGSQGSPETNQGPYHLGQIKMLFKQGIVPDGPVRDKLLALGVRAPLVHFGDLLTDRTEFGYEGCKLALDRNSYLGTTDHEIEMERDDPSADPSAVLLKLLGDQGIPYRIAYGKKRRFFDRLDALKKEEAKKKPAPAPAPGKQRPKAEPKKNRVPRDPNRRPS